MVNLTIQDLLSVISVISQPSQFEFCGLYELMSLYQHWYSMSRLWLSGRFRRRFSQKALRYQKVRRQGFYAWQEDLDRMLKINDRISETCAFRKAKYIRPRTHAFQSRRELDKKANPDLAPALVNSLPDGVLMSDDDSESDIAFTDVAEGFADDSIQQRGVVPPRSDVPTNEGLDDGSDWEVR